MRLGREVGFSTVPEWLLYADVSAYAVRVWAILDRHADAGGHCFPSIARISRLGKCARATVKRALKELEGVGAVTVTPRADEDGQTTNLYTLRVSPQNPPQVSQNRGVGHQRTGGGSPESHRTKAIERKPVEVKTLAVDPFDEFWTRYPLKKAKAAARKAWDKRMKAGDDPAPIVAAAGVFAAWVVEALRVGELESMKYVKHPATWLNAGCDTDHLTRPGRAPGAISKFERARAEREARRGQATRNGSGGIGDGRLGLGDGPGDLRPLGGSNGGPVRP